jgi:phosphoribosylglycinamide formyltransferase-1
MSRLILSEEAGDFASLCDTALFAQAYLELLIVTWPDGIGLAPDAMRREIHQHGKWAIRQESGELQLGFEHLLPGTIQRIDPIPGEDTLKNWTSIMPEGIHIGVLVSSRGTKLQAVIDACETGLINGRVVFVCSDNPDAYALARASQHGIPSFVVDYAEIRQRFRREPQAIQLPADCDFEHIMTCQRVFDASPETLVFRLKTRVMAEEQMLRQMAPHPLDLLVLAGFVRKLSPYFIEKINYGSAIPRIMNLHPTLCPAFPGIDGYGQTLHHGCKVAGCTVHFVDYGVDTGPIIDQDVFKIEPDDTIASVKQKGIRLECSLYPKCIALFAENRLRLRESETGRIVVDILN